MSIMADHEIEERCMGENPMIYPFYKGLSKSPSYGLSSYGYDVRLKDGFKLFKGPYEVEGGVIDPLNFDPRLVQSVEADKSGRYIIPPHSFILAETVEVFDIPRDVLVICLGKSTYARCGLIVNVTPLEPEWKGSVTIEISNTTPLPAAIYTERGIAQMLFLKTSGEPCETSYADKRGKYQNQRGVTLPR